MKHVRIVKTAIACLLLAGLAAQTSAAGQQSADPAGGDPSRGETLYKTRCIACHSLDRNRVGPRHRGVFGRRSGSLADYAYSAALRGSTLVWNAANLNAWLTDPGALIPGQRMGFRISRAEDRRDIIAYLKTTSRERGR